MVLVSGMRESERTRRTCDDQVDYAFPDKQECDQVNSGAVFHPKVESEGVPCVEVGGVLVAAYLDESDGAVHVSVDLEATDGRLVRSDGTVPLCVEVEGTVVADGRYRGISRCVLSELLDAADEHQDQTIRDTALAVGVLWRCPACWWDNPREALHCQAADSCRTRRPRPRS
ncbi:hypothetical protein [Streptomyces sp. SM12]|uniref:hypothetical protein n=1 Tax=Streptomyces sp. SM12 TaxID=1071602 RepID=UPI000CD5C516|nr:hypothetical protein [Streptomyces sp. SM12]